MVTAWFVASSPLWRRLSSINQWTIVLLNERARLSMWQWQNTFVVIALPVAAVSAKGLRDGARGDSKWLNCDDWLSDFADIWPYDGSLWPRNQSPERLARRRAASSCNASQSPRFLVAAFSMLLLRIVTTYLRARNTRTYLLIKCWSADRTKSHCTAS